MPTPLGLVALAALAALGCDLRPLPLEAPDAGAAAGDAQRPGSPAAPGGPSVPAGRSGCDPVAQDCGANIRCSPDCNRQSFVCAPRHSEARGRQGSLCSHDEDCVVGFACFADLRGGTTPARCARYCRESRDCDPGTQCVSQPLVCDPGDERRTLPRRLCVQR
jgi:hypothetical protein